MILYMSKICLPHWALIAGMIILPFAGIARRMGSFQSLVWLNIITLCGTICIPLGYYVIVGVEDIRPENSGAYAVSSLTATGVLSGLSTFTFGMTSQFMLTEIIAEMS